MGFANVACDNLIHRALLPSRVAQVDHSYIRVCITDAARWLARKDRWEDCHHVLALVHAKGNRESPFVLQELQEIKDMCEFERRNSDVSYLELFKPHMINRTHIGVFTQIWSQLTGMTMGILRLKSFV
jgi:Sugar (and other) transporter